MTLHITDRIAFHLGETPIYWYGVFVMLGVMSAWFVMHKRAPATGIPDKDVGNLLMCAIGGGIIGARALFVLTDWSYFVGNPGQILNIRAGGLVFYGGFFGGAGAVICYSYVRHLQIWQVADLFAFGVPMGQVLGRFGCLINGCCFGKPTDGHTALIYRAYVGQKQSLLESWHQGVWHTQLDKKVLNADYMTEALQNPNLLAHCHPVVPTQFFQSLTNLGIVVLLLVYARFAKKTGQFFGLFLMLYATGRFLNEFNRGDYPQLIHGFTNAQVLCFFLFPLGLIIFLGRSRFGKAAYCTKNGAFGSSSPQAEKAAPSGDAQNG